VLTAAVCWHEAFRPFQGIEPILRAEPARRDRLESMSFLPGQRLSIVIAGGSGQIGHSLAAHFQRAGHRVVVLTRAPYTANWPTIYWNPEDEDGPHENSWVESLEGADVLINLAGRSIACPLTRRNRVEIRDSRILSTRLLGRVLGTLQTPPQLWLNASSAIAGSLSQSLPARGVPAFMSRITDEWEAEFFNAPLAGVRRVALRTGLFLAPAPGNRFALLSTLVRAGIGGTLGNGLQWVSWIHAADYARAVDLLIERDDLSGPITLAAPEPVTNRDFMAALRDVWQRPNGVIWPAPLMHIIGLARADASLALYSCHAEPDQLLQAGFTFEFADWPTAAEDLAREWRQLDH